MSQLATIILAAGKGTRMKSSRSKVSFPLAGKSLIQRVVDTSLQINADIICTVVGHQKEEVKALIQDTEGIVFVEQNEQKGTGHAVIMTEEIFKNFTGTIFILCGDVPLLRAETLQEMLAYHKEKKAACTILTMVLPDPGKYGRMLRDDNGIIYKIKEFKDATEEERAVCEVNSGIYCFDAELLFEALQLVDNKNNQNEYYLTDTIEILYKKGHIISGIVLKDIYEAAGVNSQEQLAELENVLFQNVRSHYLNNGVVIENPQSVIIDDTVVIDPDVTILGNCRITGTTHIHTNAVIGYNSMLHNADIQSNAVLQGFNVVVNRTLKEAEILPYRETRIYE